MATLSVVPITTPPAETLFVIEEALTALLDTAERTGDFRSTMARLATLYEDGFR